MPASERARHRPSELIWRRWWRSRDSAEQGSRWRSCRRTTPVLSDSLEAVRRRINDRRCAGDQIGHQMPGARCDAEAVAGEAAGNEEAGKCRNGRNDGHRIRRHIDQSGPTAPTISAAACRGSAPSTMPWTTASWSPASPPSPFRSCRPRRRRRLHLRDRFRRHCGHGQVA